MYVGQILSMQTTGTIPGYFIPVDTIQEKWSIAAGAEMNYVEILGHLCITSFPSIAVFLWVIRTFGNEHRFYWILREN